MTLSSDGKLHISNSEIKTYHRCRRKWMLHYYMWWQRQQQEDFSTPLTLGSAVHESLEQYYINHLDPATYLRGIYEDRLQEADRLGYFESVIVSVKKERDLALAMVDGLLDWQAENGIDNGMTLIGVEKNLEAPLPNGTILRGKLDQQWRLDDGRVIFRDWKTCQSFSSLEDGFLLNEQIKMYQLLERLTDPNQITDGAQFVMMRKVKRTGNAKPPFYKAVKVRPNTAEIDSMFRRTVRSTTEISNLTKALDANHGIDALQYACPPSPTRDCNWDCPFYDVCPLMDDGSNWDGLLHERYEKINPDERYNDNETANTK